MFSCAICKRKVGYFEVTDRICKSCANTIIPETKGRIRRSLDFAPITGFLFILGFPIYTYLIYTGFIYTNAGTIMLSLVMLTLAILALACTFLARFYVVRRAFNLPIAVIFILPFFVILSLVHSGLGVGGPMPATTYAFFLFPYYVLRTPNRIATMENAA